MHQQLLDVRLSQAYTYGDWHRHAGAEEALNRLALWMVHGGRVWLSSEQPAGKTHLVHALREEHPQLGMLCVNPRQHGHAMQLVSDWLSVLQEKALWMVDIEAGAMPIAHGLALFHLIERSREANRPLLIAWRCPDTALAPAELASRLKAFEHLEIIPPQTDEDMRSVLLSVSASRQWPLAEDIIDLVLTRCPRRLMALLSTLQEMENVSLAGGHRLSLAWARRYLKQKAISG